MIQDILPYQFDNTYKDVKPDAESFLVFIKEQTILVKLTEEIIELPKLSEIPYEKLHKTYLFSISNSKFFLADSLANSDNITALIENGYNFYNISILRKYNPKWLGFAGVTAYQLGSWYDKNRFCGRCGATLKNGIDERSLHCENCKQIIYPKIQPAVIVAVTNNNRIILTKYANREHSKNYALIAGFAEIGESIEETVRREVMEEVGVKVKNIQYYKSQPWAFSDTLLLGFFCELDGSDEIVMDTNELRIAKWVTRAELPSKQEDISLTYEMMLRFKERGWNFNSSH
ncbi:MAG: NAD(+) diphosphatase [Clostridiales bacterium]|nr:NAD(+) diphosphatase [Clostridiales bacterium]